MSEIKIETGNAIKAYNQAAPDLKVILATLLGEGVVNQKITDRVKTYEDACRVLEVDPDDMPFEEPRNGDDVSVNAYQMLIRIVRALNEGWTPDWSDNTTAKYYPWFEHKSGFGLSYYGYDYASTCAGVGSRLVFKSRELAEYAGKQFQDIYIQFLSL